MKVSVFTYLSLMLIFILGLACCKDSVATQIPNGDFENWGDVGGWYENPVGWTTNNAQLGSIEVRKDTNAYHGNYAMELITYYTNSRAFAQVGFSTTTHPLNLMAYIKCSLADSDTVSVKITLFNNGLLVDSGLWFSTSSISNYIQVTIPISQNATIVDSAIVVISGGSRLISTNNGTKFWVDYISLSYP